MYKAVMILTVALVLALQVPPPPRTAVRDSTKPDSTLKGRRAQPIRRPVTEALRASAFKDAPSRDLIAKARLARLAQDSSITGYDAKVSQRLSVKAAVGGVPLERLAYRHEGVARVQWQRGVGAHIDVTAGRVTIPPLGMPSVERDALEDAAADPGLIPLPYFPGQEPLWVGQFAARPDVNERDLVNPLANGAEAYYTYASGDLTTIRLGNGDSLVVRQIDVRPRESTVNTLVGSLWLDAMSGQVVRAAYRLAAPGRAAVSVGPDSSGKSSAGTKIVGTMMKALMPTMVAEVTDIVVEYQRVRNFWLPRSQVMEGFVKSSFAKVPVTVENGFRFESVNETAGLSAITVDTMSTRTKVVGTDTVRSIDQCRTSDSRVVTTYKAGVPVSLRVPCDLEKLSTSPDLPASAFADNEELFGTAQRDELVAQALSLADQSPFGGLFHWSPSFEYGVSQTRYNRIEGLSTAVVMTQQYGGGVDLRLGGRLGTADHRPRIEGSIGRSNASRTVRLGGYDRLVAMTDWETPLSFGSSLSAFLFGRDDAFYYRTAGAELSGRTERGRDISWRAYLERAGVARMKTDFSVGGSFMPNIAATPGWYSGIEARYRASRGLDPRGFRIATDFRGEVATPLTSGPFRTAEVALMDSSYFARGSAEATISKGLARRFDVALTLSGGTSLGDVPVQKLWYLGGTQTIRGLGPSPTQAGNAYWFTRTEFARPIAFTRVSLFGDIGWAGDRGKIDQTGRPLSGAGVGFSFLDGAARFDIARGIYPTKDLRVSFYLGARF